MKIAWIPMALAGCGAAAPTAAAPPDPDLGALGKTTCADLVDAWPDRYESCAVERVVDGRALRVTLRFGCGGDSCAVEEYVVVPGRTPVHVGGGGAVLVDPELRFALVDTVELERHLDGRARPGRWEVYVIRVDLETGARARWADCMSPALSPGRRWVVCRDAEGGAYRTPVEGGAWEEVYRFAAPHPDARIDWAPYGWRYPDPVGFPARDRIRITTALGGGAGVQVDERDWAE